MDLPYLSYKFMSILFKIQGYCLKDINENGKTIELEVVPTMRKYCKCCLSDKRYDSRVRKIYVGSVLGTPAYAVLRVYRIKCTLRANTVSNPSQFLNSLFSIYFAFQTQPFSNFSRSNIIYMPRHNLKKKWAQRLQGMDIASRIFIFE